MQGEGRKSSARSSCEEGEIMFEQVSRYERCYRTNGLQIQAVVWAVAITSRPPALMLSSRL